MCAKFLSTTHFLFRNYDLRGFIQKQEHIQPTKLYRKLKRKFLLLAPSCICVLKFVTLMKISRMKPCPEGSHVRCW